MTFALNGATVASCTGAVNSSGVRSCSIQTMPAGSNAVSATYSGDTNYVVAAAGSAPYTTTALPGTLTISASPGISVAVGTSVAFTATLSASSVAPISPSGTVTFKINGASSPDCPATTIDATQKATCTTQSLVAPADIITASYAGDTNFTPVPSANFTETVTKGLSNRGVDVIPRPCLRKPECHLHGYSAVAGRWYTHCVPVRKRDVHSGRKFALRRTRRPQFRVSAYSDVHILVPEIIRGTSRLFNRNL